ncbi:MAG: mechanosensitive ion channel [Treponema sp.]|jgi:small conductance mechanosensitive channel|nr:mechanosensitive ion channel [Treponema sp.]
MHEEFLRLWTEHSQEILGAGKSLLTAVVIIIGGRILFLLVDKLILRIASEKMNFDKSVAAVLRVVLNYGIVIVCAIMVLEKLGINTTSLIAILGTAGVAIGLALKDTLGNIAAGIILLFLRPFKVGDFIEFGSVTGGVKEIGLFSTILETGDGVFISAPNSTVWGVPLKNYSRNGRRRMELAVSIRYSDSIDTAFEVLRNIIDAESRFLKEPVPQIMVQSMGESSINIMLRAWAPGDVYWQIYWDQMKNIKEQIEAAGLVIPFPQREITITGNPHINVNEPKVE